MRKSSGQPKTDQGGQSTQAQDPYDLVLAKAYDYLARRSHSRGELRHKLDVKKFDPSLIEKVLDHLADLGYVNDQDFARFWVMTRGHGRGPQLLRQELRRKYLSDEVIDQALHLHRTEHDLTKEAEVLAHKKIHQWRDRPWPKVQNSLTGFLLRRGYPYETIKKVVDRLKNDFNDG